MAKFKSFPHYEINVKDESGANVLAVEELSLHRPLYFGLAEKGPINVPVYGSYSELASIFGEGTFDEYSKYFKHQTVFVKENVKYQKVFFVRVAPDTAAEAGLVIEAEVTDDGSSVTVNWNTRALASGESINNIAPATSGNTTTYPVYAIKMKYAGEFGNNVGVSIYSDSDNNDDSSRLGTRLYNISFFEIPYGSNTAFNILDKFLSKVQTIAFKPNTVDPDTGVRLYYDDIMYNNFEEGAIPFDSYLYSENVEAIGTAILNYDTSNGGSPAFTDPWLVDIFGKDDNKTYDLSDPEVPLTNVTITNSLFEDVINYAVGGSDGLSGTIADNLLFETLVQNWLTTINGVPSVFPDILDNSRYPITHLYDSGFITPTKEKLIDFASVRDDIKITISTQSVYNSSDGSFADPNTSAEDYSAGSILATQAKLHPESFLFGTQACRFAVYAQCGKIVTNNQYIHIVPATIDAMVKKAYWQGATYVKGEPKGLPSSEVTILKDVNWFPASDTVKQLDWDAGINYMQYYDMTSYHYPSTKTVYANDTSLLSDDIFVDYIVYLKHLARIEWAKYAGVSYSVSKLIGNIERTLTSSIYKALGSYIRTEVTAYQTAEDAALGYQLTVQIAVYDTPANRVWKVIIPVRREEV